MRICSCWHCGGDKPDNKILPYNIVFPRPKDRNIRHLTCSQCGRRYDLSLTQNVLLYTGLTLVISLALLIFDDSFLRRLLGAVFIAVFYPVPFCLTWNKVRWKPNDGKSKIKWADILFIIAYIAAHISGYLIYVTINYRFQN